MFGHRKCDERLSELERKAETLERQNRDLQLEWESTYEKLRLLVARITKRADRAIDAAIAESAAASDRGAAGAGNGNGATQGNGTSDRVPRQWELAALAARSSK